LDQSFFYQKETCSHKISPKTHLGQTSHQTGQTSFSRKAREELKSRAKLNLSINQSPDSPNRLQRNFGDAWVTSWMTYPSMQFHQNTLNHRKSQISWLNLKNSGSTKNHQIGELSTGLEGKGHQEKRHKVLMCDSHNKSRKERPSKSLHENCQEKAPKITKKEKRERQQKP
jgi:hypothetical protein